MYCAPHKKKEGVLRKVDFHCWMYYRERGEVFSILRCIFGIFFCSCDGEGSRVQYSWAFADVLQDDFPFGEFSSNFHDNFSQKCLQCNEWGFHVWTGIVLSWVYLCFSTLVIQVFNLWGVSTAGASASCSSCGPTWHIVIRSHNAFFGFVFFSYFVI